MEQRVRAVPCFSHGPQQARKGGGLQHGQPGRHNFLLLLLLLALLLLLPLLALLLLALLLLALLLLALLLLALLLLLCRGRLRLHQLIDSFQETGGACVLQLGEGPHSMADLCGAGSWQSVCELGCQG